MDLESASAIDQTIPPDSFDRKEAPSPPEVSEETLIALLENKLAGRIKGFLEDLQAFQENEKLLEEKRQEFLSQAKGLFMAKLLTRVSSLCLSSQNQETEQEISVLLYVITQLSQSSSVQPISAIDKQVQDIQKTAAEFHKQVAQKEKIIADKITKSQQHIAGIQQKMTRK
jgi:hypothetical protein